MMSKMIFSLMLVVCCGVISIGSAADLAGKNVVITIGHDLFTADGYESSCIGVMLGNMHRRELGADVSLFATLDGAAIANKTQLFYAEVYAKDIGHWRCNTPNGPATLTDVLNRYVAGGGNIVICPVCWAARYPDTDPKVEGAIMGLPVNEEGNPASIPQLFGNADRVIDF